MTEHQRMRVRIEADKAATGKDHILLHPTVYINDQPTKYTRATLVIDADSVPPKFIIEGYVGDLEIASIDAAIIVREASDAVS